MNKREFGPIEAAGQNPMILVFLQRDVTQMGNLTGGAPGYFQQGLRQGFRNSGDTLELEEGNWRQIGGSKKNNHQTVRERSAYRPISAVP